MWSMGVYNWWYFGFIPVRWRLWNADTNRRLRCPVFSDSWRGYKTPDCDEPEFCAQALRSLEPGLYTPVKRLRRCLRIRIGAWFVLCFLTLGGV
jgi:hypothetical protein